jgi:uncharacterized damage-inducible protein DinB
MYVAPEARGRGVGRALMEALVARCRALEGLEQIVLDVATVATPARRLYAEMGFEPFGHRREAMKDGDASYDVEHMALRLAPGPAAAGRTFREGAVGALMDEYERAVADLSRLVGGLGAAEFEAVRDLETEDESCRSIRTVVDHVVRACYGYADKIREAFGEPRDRPEVRADSPAQTVRWLATAMAYTEATLEGKWRLSEDAIMGVRIHAAWGVTYDLEQMLEHAIVHVLRHRRQIERFLSDPRFAPREAAPT